MSVYKLYVCMCVCVCVFQCVHMCAWFSTLPKTRNIKPTDARKIADN